MRGLKEGCSRTVRSTGRLRHPLLQLVLVQQFIFEPLQFDFSTVPIAALHIEIIFDKSFGQLARCIFLTVSISGVGYSVTVQQVRNSIKYIIYEDI